MSAEITAASRTDSVIATDLALVVAIKGSASTPVGSTSTSTVTRVAANAANVTLLAANAARRGATIFNNSMTQILYIKLGATANIGAGTESFTTALPAATSGVGGYYEVPYGYTGRIDGIWAAADAAGEALIDELTA